MAVSSSLLVVLPILSLHILSAHAQHNAPLQGPFITSTYNTPSPTSAASPSFTSLSAAALTSLANPFDTESDNDTASQNPRPLLDLYFLLLLVGLIAVVVALYWFYVKKRTRRFRNSTRTAQHALAADLERWPADARAAAANGGGSCRRYYFASGRIQRWNVLRNTPSPHMEGLNEHGEAPPAYVAKPEPAHTMRAVGGDGDGVVDGRSPSSSSSSGGHEWIEMQGKPPDYQERHRAVATRRDA